MKKTLKIIFCSLVIVTILTANVFASGWAGYTPNFASDVDLLFTENITSTYSAETLGELIDNAYALGMFGGAVPFAVTTVPVPDYTNAFEIAVICVSPLIISNMSGIEPTKSSTYGMLMEHETSDYAIAPTQGDVIMQYALLTTGDYFAFPDAYYYNYVPTSQNEKILLIKDENGQWYYDDNTSIFAQFNNVDATENAALTQINDKYLNALEGYTPPSEPQEPPVYVQYMLDIPSIITAIPNGAKQIINNAFGFEIFDINVAGLLSALIIIAIVAYAVNKMMTR